MFLFLVALLSVFFYQCSLAYDQEVVESFHVRPQIKDKVTAVINGPDGKPYGCFFSFLAEGGTHEEWRLTLAVDPADSSQVYCEVTRPENPSYLLFSNWTMKLKGPKGTRTVSATVKNQQEDIDSGLYVRDRKSVTMTGGVTPYTVNLVSLTATSAL